MTESSRGSKHNQWLGEASGAMKHVQKLQFRRSNFELKNNRVERVAASRQMPSINDEKSVPSVSTIRERTQSIFGKRACLWQINVARIILQGNQDVVSIAGTGMGKTLTFWMPLLFRPSGIQIIVTPLNILGQQNAEILGRAGLKGIFIGGDTATPENFQVHR